MKTRSMRGDLSAPVLAIIVTIGIIAAGLVLLAWFWWFAPTAGKAGSLQILGTPVLVKEQTWVAYISVRNTGNDEITITGVVIEGVTCDPGYTGDANKQYWLSSKSNTIQPADSDIIRAVCSGLTDDKLSNKYTATGQILTNYGTYAVNLAIAK